MKRYLLILSLCSSLLACRNDGQAIRIMCEDIHEHYPVATLQDIYKTCYQDFFGAEHLMTDTAAARIYLQTELSACSDEDLSAMPMYEPTGFRHRFMRVNLALVLQNELTQEELLHSFIVAAGKNNAQHANWQQEWQQIERIALQVNPDWADTALQDELHQAAELKAAVRHSEQFRSTYHPHYRIVRNQ